MFILKLKPYKLYANRSFRQRVTSPTYEVDSPKSKLCQFANTGPLLPLHAYQLFLVLLSTAGPNKPLNMCTQNLNSFPLLNRAAVGWAVSCFAFGLCFFKPRSRRLGGFLLCLRFIKPRSLRLGGFLICLRFIFFFSLSVTISKPPRMMSSSANYRPFLSSFRHIPPQESFVKLAN